jgi:hypothetical protein
VKTNKNDYIDAEAIAEAWVGRGCVSCPSKVMSSWICSPCTVRERWVRNRTALLNQIRGLLLERGITIRKGRRHAEEALPTILEDAEANLTGMMRQLLARLASELKQLEVQIAEIDAMIAGKADDQKACQRLMAIPGRAQGTRSKGQSLLETAIAINLVAAPRLSPRACSSALETHPASLSLFLLPLFVMLGKVIVARHVLDAWKRSTREHSAALRARNALPKDLRHQCLSAQHIEAGLEILGCEYLRVKPHPRRILRIGLFLLRLFDRLVVFDDVFRRVTILEQPRRHVVLGEGSRGHKLMVHPVPQCEKGKLRITWRRIIRIAVGASRLRIRHAILRSGP